jgi:hypothetical protein
MNMTLSNLNFLDKNTVWYKPKNPNTQDFVKARHLKKMDDGREIWVGYNSEVKKITFKDNPFASAGYHHHYFYLKKLVSLVIL